MILEIELDQTKLMAAAKSAIADYVYSHDLIKHQVRNAIYEIVSDETLRVLKKDPDKLAKLVMQEIKDYLSEREES